jgi:hypothetical protein
VTGDALTEYVDAIERELSRHRGHERALSPPDFALVRGWYDGGVPLARVLDAIDAAARGGDALNSLTLLARTLKPRPRL